MLSRFSARENFVPSIDKQPEFAVEINVCQRKFHRRLFANDEVAWTDEIATFSPAYSDASKIYLPLTKIPRNVCLLMIGKFS